MEQKTKGTMEEKSAPILRIPASLMPSYNNVAATEEGKKAPKRVRVLCGACNKIRYYSVHRGVTRIGGVIACEACRAFYQKFKKQPSVLACSEGGSCITLNDNSRIRCRACWVGHILSHCPVPPEVYHNLISHLPKEIQNKMPPEAQVLEKLPEDKKGALALEVSRNGTWEDVTIACPPPAEGSAIDQCENTNDGDSSIGDTSLGQNPEHFGDTNDSESFTDGVSSSYTCHNDNYSVQWYMQNDGSNQTYFNMGNMNSTPDGLISLSAMQSVDGFQPLMPLTPVQYEPEEEHHSNGFHDVMPLNSIKQENDIDIHDGESQEARLFQGISVKKEFYSYENTDIEAPIYGSPYFDQIKTEEPTTLDIKFVTQTHEILNGQNDEWNMHSIKEEPPSVENIIETPVKNKKKSRSKKIKEEDQMENSLYEGAELMSPPEGGPKRERRKFDRFNGVPVEEVAKKFLPDHLAENLDILIVGINPGLFAAHVGHHYAGPGNHFWKCMYLSGLIPEPFNAYDDFKMLNYGIGFTNVVARTTRSSTDLSKKEMKEGSEILKAKIQQYRPRIAVFNGKTIYEMYSGSKNFCFGIQDVLVEGTNTHLWVMPSSSARCAQLPRAVDKVPFYAALRKFLDYLNGRIPQPPIDEIKFSSVLVNFKKPKEEGIEEGTASPQKRKNEEAVSPQKK